MIPRISSRRCDDNAIEGSSTSTVTPPSAFCFSDPTSADVLWRGRVELKDSKGSSVAIKSTKVVASKGAYSPFTPSEKIVVNDFLASSIRFYSQFVLSKWCVHHVGGH